MQVNSAQDYLTAQKRRIVSANFAANPPARQRKYNYVYLSVLANKATQYNKVPYPQPIGLAAGSVPGGVYQSTGAINTPMGQGTRPTVSDCVNCPTVAVNNAPPGSLV
jgi:hypothetical protein